MEDIHLKIKNLRMERGLTLKELSIITGLSISFLSQVEHGTSSLAITSLSKIADAFKIPIGYFFEESVKNDYATTLNSQKEFRLGSSQIGLVRLSKSFPNRAIDTFIAVLNPNYEDEEFMNHVGEESYYVLEGVLKVLIQDHEYLLTSGESIHFPSTLSHKWGNPSDKYTKVLVSVSPVIFN